MTKINGDANSPPHTTFSSKEAANDPYVERILEAARQLFIENGLEAVSMHRIAKKAEIGQASLYRRFTDIGEICSVLLRDNSERFLNGMEQEVQQLASELPAFERLQSSIERIVDFLEQHAELLNLIKTEFTGKKQLTQFEHPFFQRLNLILFQLLQQVAAEAESIPIDPQFVATALVSVLSPDLYLFQKKVHGRSKEQITKGIITLFVTGLRNP